MFVLHRDKEIMQLCANGLGVAQLYTGPHSSKDANGKKSVDFWVDTYWIASTTYFHPYSTITVAAIHTDKWNRVFLMLKNKDEDNTKYKVKDTLSFPLLADPIVKAFASLNLSFSSKEINLLSGYTSTFIIDTIHCGANLSVKCPSTNSSLKTLNNALLMVIYGISERYNDNEINTVLGLKPYPIY